MLESLSLFCAEGVERVGWAWGSQPKTLELGRVEAVRDTFYVRLSIVETLPVLFLLLFFKFSPHQFSSYLALISGGE